MGVEQLVWLVQTPSSSAHMWRDTLAQACLAHGWDFAVHDQGHPLPKAVPGRSLLVAASFDEPESADITHRTVQLSPPLEAAEVLKSQWDLNDHDAFYAASLRLAAAWELVERGASVSWSDAPEIEIVGLGKIAGPVAQPSPYVPRTDHPLVMFEKGSAAGLQVIRWKPDLFLYPDARPSDGPVGSFPLVGRRRLLLNGPNIFLPAGCWSFVAEISIDPPGKTELLIEWGHAHDVASLLTPIEAAGRYELSLEKEWTAFHPADFRISLMIPALEGEFCFHGGTLTRTFG